MKKIIILAGVVLVIAFTLFGKKEAHVNNEKKVIGIIQFAEHPALDAARLGFISKLKLLGCDDQKDVQILFESAQGNPALASQIAQKFVGQSVDLIVALGTTPAQAALQNIMQLRHEKVMPLVFLSVSNPSEAKLVTLDAYNNLNSKYATGVSDFVEPQDHLKVYQSILPSLVNLGLIYNPGEANSTFLLKGLEDAAKSFNINIIAIPATKTSEVILATQNLIGKVDAIFIDNDNTALSALDAISGICKKNKIPLFASDIDLADKALACLGPDQKRIGEQGAQLAVLLLNKKSLPEDLGVQYPDHVELHVNKKFAYEISFEIPAIVLEKAKKVIQ
jgi:putative ABC transport system substrate-binding protein